MNRVLGAAQDKPQFCGSTAKRYQALRSVTRSRAPEQRIVSKGMAQEALSGATLHLLAERVQAKRNVFAGNFLGSSHQFYTECIIVCLMM